MLYRAADIEAGQTARWLGLMSTADPEKAAAFATAAGGRVLIRPTELPGRGQVALLADPEGARFGVLRTLDGDPPDLFPDTGDFLWRELWARDGAAMADFYSALSGARSQRVDSDAVPTPEWHLLAAGYPRAGILQEPAENLPSAWLQYVRVGNLERSLARVVEHGGSVLLYPDDSIRNGAVAIITDPQGAALGLAEWRESAPAGGDK
jgi:predicted enzyme related to lactoylglutathione lyase